MTWILDLIPFIRNWYQEKPKIVIQEPEDTFAYNPEIKFLSGKLNLILSNQSKKANSIVNYELFINRRKMHRRNNITADSSDICSESSELPWSIQPANSVKCRIVINTTMNNSGKGFELGIILKDQFNKQYELNYKISVIDANIYPKRLYEESKQRRESKEILEKILNPIYKEMKEIILFLEELTFPSSFEKQRGYIKGDFLIWAKIKHENLHLLCGLKGQIKSRLNEFFQKLEKFIYFYNQCMSLLEDFMLEEIKNKLKKDSFIGGLRALLYQINIGGKLHTISLYKLIFRDQTLDEYIVKAKNDTSILNKDIEKEAFIIEGLRGTNFKKEDFMEIDFKIKQRILKDAKLHEFLKKCRLFYTETQNLRKDLELEMARFSI